MSDHASPTSKKHKSKKGEISRDDARALEAKLVEMESRTDKFEKIVVKRLDDISTDKIVAPLNERETKLHTAKLVRVRKTYRFFM